MNELRPYQATAIERVIHAWDSGRRAPLLVAPTGSGKTRIAVELIRREVGAGRRALFLAPRRELIEQASCQLHEAYIEHSVLMAGVPMGRAYLPVTVASVDTVRARLRAKGQIPVPDPDLVLADEAHLFQSNLRRKLLNHWPNARICGLSATPAGPGGQPLGSIFDELIEVASVAELTEAGYLAPVRYYSISEPDLRRVTTVRGDYHRGQLSAVMAPLVGDVVETWLKRAGERRTVVFACDVGHSVALAAEFVAHGVRAEHVDAGTPTAERAAVFDRIRQGETTVLVNCSLAAYGLDIPAVDCVTLARPTRSVVLFLQMAGRGLRPSPEKYDLLVLDHSGAVRRFGFIDDPRQWSLSQPVASTRTEKASSSLSEADRLRKCPECSALFRGLSCPSCGWHHKPRPKPVRTLDGNLVEVSKTRPNEPSPATVFAMLLGHCHLTGAKPGFAAHLFKERYGEWPKPEWRNRPTMKPSDAIAGWIQSRRIRFLRSKERGLLAPRE